MPMISDSRWEFCWYHQMRLYFGVDNGLWQSQEQKKDGLLNVVFPALNSYRDESVTKNMTVVIRQKLHKDCPPNTKQSFAAKSLRQGSIGESLLEDLTQAETDSEVSPVTNAGVANDGVAVAIGKCTLTTKVTQSVCTMNVHRSTSSSCSCFVEFHKCKCRLIYNTFLLLKAYGA
jgi:hypothetical protein